MKNICVMVLLGAMCIQPMVGCAAESVAEEQVKVKRMERVHIPVGNLAVLHLYVPMPNYNNMPWPVRDLSASELVKLAPGKYLDVFGRTWDKWRSDFAFGEISYNIAIGRLSPSDVNGADSLVDLLRYFQRKVGNVAKPKTLLVGKAMFVQYSIEHLESEGTSRVASEIFAVPLEGEYYAFVSFEFVDPDGKYRSEWLAKKRGDAYKLMEKFSVEALPNKD